MVARRLRLSLVWLCVLAGGLASGCVSARAALTHAYLSQITEVPAGSGAPLPGLLFGLGPMTVDSGHLWAADFAGAAIHVNEFDAATGGFVAQLPQVSPASGLEDVGLGVAVAHGNVYLGAIKRVAGEAEGRLGVFSEAGVLQATWTGAATPAGSFGLAGVADVAVDRSVGGLAAGSVYVDDARQKVVDVFKPEGVGKEPPVVEPSAGHVVQLTGTCPVEGTACAPLEIIPFNDPSHVSVDDSTGHVLVLDSIQEEIEGSVVERNVVDVFEPEVLGGYVFLRQIKLPLGLNAKNLGVDGGNGEVYVAAEGEVDQFSSTGVLLGRITGEGTPGGDLRVPQSVAVDPVSHHVFIGDYRISVAPPQPSAIDVFGPDLVIPDVTTGPAASVTPRSAILTGTVKLDKEGEASCRFVWGTSREFGQPPVSCSAPATEEEGAVQAILSLATGSELEPDTTYYYRLQATNKNGLNPGEAAQDQQFTTAGPGIHEEAVSDVAATSATFTARVNPHNAPTTSYFQYGTTGAYGTNVPVAPGLSLGSGEGDVEASPQHVQGLEGDTVYHYRVVAISELAPGRFEEFDGPDQTFTTQQSGGVAGLPDGRSWELVTPPEKKGALFFPIQEGGIIQASSDGSAIADLASQPTESEPQGSPPKGVSVLSTRGVAGWSSQDISPPHDKSTDVVLGEGVEYRFFSEDLSNGIVDPFGRSGSFTPLSPQATEATPYLRTDFLNGDVSAHCQSSCFTPLVTAGNTPPGTVFGGCPDEVDEKGNHLESEGLFCGPIPIVATPDLSHVVLRVRGLGIVEWADGKLTPTGGVFPFGVFPSTTSQSARHAISDDGSRIVGVSESGSNKGLFLRDMLEGETIRLDLPQGGTGGGSQEPAYMTASNDDSRIFFLDKEHLTAESSASGLDLYEYDLHAPLGSRLTDLTVDKHANEVANVARVVGASEDGSYVYFAAEGALAPGAVHGACGGNNPSPGDTKTCNLYVRHAGVTRLVAALSIEDYPDWGPLLPELPVRVSPNGRWLAFMSNRSLTGYDMRDAISGRADEEVYLYDATGNKLVCASCNPSGARPVGVEGHPGLLVDGSNTWSGGAWLAANVPGWTGLDISTSRYQSRYLSDSGRLFFDSNDALVPRDVNGTEDVYVYEPVGVPALSPYECGSGSAAFSVRSGGCVGLISSGASAEESAFLDANVTGGDVFFLTASKLVSQDFDTALDVYDAHECSAGAPCFARAPVSPPVCSTGDSCKAAPSPQPPVFGSPSSATFSGAGNVVPPGVAPVLKSRSLTRAQKLGQALRACKKKSRTQRSVCERRARKRYGIGKSRKANATTKSGR
jgi:WD40-like Beta Propeller Repeat